MFSNEFLNFLNPSYDPYTLDRDQTRARRRKNLTYGLSIALVALLLMTGVGIGTWRFSKTFCEVISKNITKLVIFLETFKNPIMADINFKCLFKKRYLYTKLVFMFFNHKKLHTIKILKSTVSLFKRHSESLARHHTHPS